MRASCKCYQASFEVDAFFVPGYGPCTSCWPEERRTSCALCHAEDSRGAHSGAAGETARSNVTFFEENLENAK